VSLRFRLTAISVLLVGLGLLAASVATHYELKASLIDRLDQQLTDAQGAALRSLSGDPDSQRAIQPDAYVALYSGDGRLVRARVPVDSPRTLPSWVHTAPSGMSTRSGYRVSVTDAGPPGFDGKLVVAYPLSDVNSTLSRLGKLEVLAGILVLVAVGVLAGIAVKAALRPLERIEETAGAIAAGDLTRRVEEDTRTEVGRLGRALNEMLAQIERAFNEREESERRLRRFIADASHELRTPLTSVRGYAELFRRGAAERPADLEMAMRRIEDDAARMGLLVDDLLLLARLDQGRPLEREQVDLAAVARELVEDSRLLHPAWPVELHGDAAAVVAGDELRLRQAIGNLLANARAHCPEGTAIEVTVTDGEGGVAVAVADHGPGIAPEHAERVFERFFRADPSRARASGGSGLGLSIVQSIAVAHGGSASVESTVGEGSTFTLTVPRARGLAAATEPLALPEAQR
jgi:two-component system OmpR family sensor kinase